MGVAVSYELGTPVTIYTWVTLLPPRRGRGGGHLAFSYTNRRESRGYQIGREPGSFLFREIQVEPAMQGRVSLGLTDCLL